MCVSSALAGQNPRTPVFVTPGTALSCCMCVCVPECVRVLKHTHLTIYSNFLSPLCLCVCCSAVKTCFAGLCVAIENKKRVTESLSAFPCFTASLHCCCAALCSCVLPRLPSALCVPLICPSVRWKSCSPSLCFCPVCCRAVAVADSV